MPTLTAIAYVSSATRRLSEVDMEGLLLQARTFNRDVHVTGVLLHHDGSFFQYFEGPDDAVAQVYERIRRSALHHTIFELCRGPIKQCFFADWQMGFAQTPHSQMLKLAHAEWKATATTLDGSARASVGLDLLADYWTTVAPWDSSH
jgi:hypothetical protein